jgi:hypothetical protein
VVVVEKTWCGETSTSVLTAGFTGTSGVVTLSVLETRLEGVVEVSLWGGLQGFVVFSVVGGWVVTAPTATGGPGTVVVVSVCDTVDTGNVVVVGTTASVVVEMEGEVKVVVVVSVCDTGDTGNVVAVGTTASVVVEMEGEVKVIWGDSVVVTRRSGGLVVVLEISFVMG